MYMADLRYKGYCAAYPKRPFVRDQTGVVSFGPQAPVFPGTGVVLRQGVFVLHC